MSSSTTANNLTDAQEKIVRDFYDVIVIDESLWTNNTASRKVVGGMCLSMMGYAVTPRGEIVPDGTIVKESYGQGMLGREGPPMNILYQTDGDKVRSASYESDSADQTSPSESPESDEVGDVLQQDV